MFSLVSFALFSAPVHAASGDFLVTKSAATIVAGNSSGMHFKLAASGYLHDDGDTLEVTHISDCTLSLLSDTLLCDSVLTVDDDKTTASLKIVTSGEAFWEVKDSLGLSDASIASISNGFLMEAASSELSGAIHGWSWPDGKTPKMIAEWLLQDLLKRDDVLVYVDGVCINCLEQGIF